MSIERITNVEKRCNEEEGNKKKKKKKKEGHKKYVVLGVNLNVDIKDQKR